MKTKIALFCVFVSFSSGNLLFAEQREYLAAKENLLEKIRICADYACDVLLDEEGKSRCDYDIFESRWTPYETPWHTGQLINALLEAYQQKDGAMFYHADLDGNIDKSSICSSEVAFAGLLWMRLFRYGYPEFEKFFEKSVSWLMSSSFSSGHPDPNLRGAVVEVTTRISKGKTKIINRDIGTSFALRFLTSYYHLRFTF